MTYSNILIKELTELANRYSSIHIGYPYSHPIAKSDNALIFKEVESNFHKRSWANILQVPKYFERTLKVHSHFKSIVPVVYEMQSSNSSDALTMNIFCYPETIKWQGITELLKIEKLSDIDFGFKAKVFKIKEPLIEEDATEIDLYLNKKIICECKLKEDGFYEKEKSEVEKCVKFRDIFITDKLIQDNNHYYNYQLIRNILAANQHSCRFILFCDMRRPDLARSFYHTIRCINDEHIELRTNCEIIYWQDIARVVGKELKVFLKEKYGIF